MTKQEAIGITEAAKMGIPVKALELQEAIVRLARKRDKCVRLPRLTEAARAKANLVLVWNLWQAVRVQ